MRVSSHCAWASQRAAATAAVAAFLAVMAASAAPAQQAPPESPPAAWRVECSGDGKTLECRAAASTPLAQSSLEIPPVTPHRAGLSLTSPPKQNTRDLRGIGNMAPSIMPCGPTIKGPIQLLEPAHERIAIDLGQDFAMPLTVGAGPIFLALFL